MSQTEELVLHYQISYVFTTEFLLEGHRIFVDSYYTCPLLARELYFKDTFITGTVRANRVGMPTNKIEVLKLEENQLKTSTIFLCIWMYTMTKRSNYTFYQVYM